MIVLPSSYLPPISYLREVVANPSACVVDMGEHYIKRSIRNRTRIMTAQGVMELTIPVCRANTPRQPMSTIEIDYSKRWQHQHWNAIIAAYRSSPYFDHYEPYLEPLYRHKAEFLTEFNEAVMEVIYKLLQVRQEARHTISKSYIEPHEGLIDLRPKGAVEAGHIATPYIQVFGDRLDFVSNLSILDLLLCEGTTAVDFLGASRR